MATDIYWPQDFTGVCAEALNLPCGQRTGYALQQRSAALRSDYGVNTRARRVYSDAPVDVDISFVLSQTQTAMFDGFFWNDLDAGTRWFWMPILAGGKLILREVNFHGEMPAISLIAADRNMYACRVSSRQGLQISPYDYAALVLCTPEDAFDILTALELFVNQDGMVLFVP